MSLRLGERLLVSTHDIPGRKRGGRHFRTPGERSYGAAQCRFLHAEAGQPITGDTAFRNRDAAAKSNPTRRNEIARWGEEGRVAPRHPHSPGASEPWWVWQRRWIKTGPYITSICCRHACEIMLLPIGPILILAARNPITVISA